jgi:hypothetical protein
MIVKLIGWVRAQNETTQGLIIAGALGMTVLVLVVVAIAAFV